ncbi:hypothetical protein RSOLAG22IIIB_05990 [Rhizoctonia solani]|uniref:Protein kinase domain-containing protein n=1 Tax=Rhizoctonia solani TaxID=456999 RepID=A0A0K6GAY8_9AGAM|nr:hypothetical protein RSOLAG22IIIB_05990 [Rhizoctonia solani]
MADSVIQRLKRRAIKTLYAANPEWSDENTPADTHFTEPSSKPYVTPNLPVGEDSDSDNADGESSQRRSATQPLNVRRPFSSVRQASPPQRSVTKERITVAVTSDTENYVVVDLTGHTDAQAIRERILSKLHIPGDLHPSFSIYRTELGGLAVGAALDDNQLLIDCQHFGDDKGTLKFLVQRADAPPESPDGPVPPILPPLSSFSPGVMRMSSSRRPGSASLASDRGYEVLVSGVSEFDNNDQEVARSPIQTLHRRPASKRGRQSTSWRVRRRGSGSDTSGMSPIAPQPPVPPGSSPEHLSNTLSIDRAQERRGSVAPMPRATRSPPGFEDPPNPSMNSAPALTPTIDSGASTSIPPHVAIPSHQTHSRRPSEPDSKYEREMALVAEERRREEENERWMAKQRADLVSKRQQWASDHPNHPNYAYQNGTQYQNGASTSGYTSAGSSSGYMHRGAPTAVAFPPNRTGSPMRTPSGHGRRPTDARPPSEQQIRAYQQQQQQQQQPQAPVRQQDPHYSRQLQRARQPSPGGQPFVQQAPPSPPQAAVHPTHAQTHPYPQQQAHPSQQPQPYQQQSHPPQQAQYVTRNDPADPPRGAMLPRTPRSEYTTQANQQWSYDSPDAVHGGTIGPMSGVGISHQRAQSPQLRDGARSMGNLRERYGAPPPAPPPPPPAAVAQWTGGRGPSPGPVLASPPGQQVQVLNPAAYDVRQQPEQQQQSQAPLHLHQSSSPLQQSQTIQQQQQQPNYGQYMELRWTSGYMEPQRTGGAYSDQRSSGGYEQRNGAFEQRSSGTFEQQPPSQRSSGFSEQRAGGFLEQQKTGGGYLQPQQLPGYDRYEREWMERESKEYEARREYEARERERKEYGQQIQQQQQQRPDPIPIQRPGSPPREQTGTSPSHTSAMPRSTTEPVSLPRATAEAMPRNSNGFSTSPRPAGPMSNWNPQNMVGLSRPNEPSTYYNVGVNGNPNLASLVRRTFSGESLAQPPQQHRPQSAYDTIPPSLRPGPRPTMQRPLADYDRPSPSDLYRHRPLPQTTQHTTSPPAPVSSRYTHFPPQPDVFAPPRPILDERMDEAYGGIEEPSTMLSVNTNTLGAPSLYESTSPSSVAGEPSPIPPQTPEPDHLELSDNGTASPSASDASTVGYAGHVRDTDSDRDSTAAVSKFDTADADAEAGTLKADDLRVMLALQRMVGSDDAKVPFKWVKGQLIGQGRFHRVYLAMNLTSGEMIVAKQVELPKTESENADSERMSVVNALKLESDILQDLDHPHIVQCLGFEGTMDTFSLQVWFALWLAGINLVGRFMEYVPGGSIGSVLRKTGKFEDEVVRSFSHQIIDGLAYLHKSGILHRDLKGDSILVNRSGICKISDFTISKRSEHVYNNQKGTIIQSSVFWTAPEVFHNNEQGYSAKIDIWSVGCVVLEMQSGRRPWMGDEMSVVMHKVGQLRQTPPVPDDVILSPVADDFRRKCFVIDPYERPAAAELLTHPWLQLPPGWVFKGFKEHVVPSTTTGATNGPPLVRPTGTPQLNPVSDILSEDIAHPSKMSIHEMFEYLTRSGCPDLTQSINPNGYSKRSIATGGFGDIYKGKLNDGTPIAIKVWRSRALDEELGKDGKRAMREIYNWSQLDHENVQKLLGVVMFDERLGMVSKWMERGNLHEYLQKNPGVDPYPLCIQVAQGVEYLHDRNMVHGDLKAINVLVSSDHKLKLTDFDYSIMAESTVFSQTTRMGGGTFRWMAPELILDLEGDQQRNKRTDIYALGMTFFEIISGTVPYHPQCKNDTGVYHAVRKKQFPRRDPAFFGSDRRGDRMWALLMRCWDHDPAARPTATEATVLLQTLVRETEPRNAA